MAGKKKDFEAINTDRAGRVLGTIEKATAKRGQQSTASEEEKAERAATGRTQGRKGCKKEGQRLNLLLETDNHRFIKIMAKATGRTMTEYINYLISAYQKEHPEFMEQAGKFLELINNEAWKDTEE